MLSRWPIIDHDVVALPLADGRPGHRHVVVAIVDAPHGPTTVMSTHLEYPFDQSALRSRQARFQAWKFEEYWFSITTTVCPRSIGRFAAATAMP